MGMAVGGSKTGPRSDINVTPLVDVVLVLLIIFMVMTPIMLKQLEVQVPKKADVEVTPDVAADQIVLSLTKEGKISINQQELREPELGPRVRDLFAKRQQKILFFNVDDDANYGFAVHLMDVCRGAGVANIGIMTKR